MVRHAVERRQGTSGRSSVQYGRFPSRVRTLGTSGRRLPHPDGAARDIAQHPGGARMSGETCKVPRDAGRKRGARPAVIRCYKIKQRRDDRVEGLPNLQDLGKLLIGENVPEMLGADRQAERAARPIYQDAIAHCETVRDYISREILERILEDTEEHIDYLETQLELLDKVGLQNYLQSQMGEAAS